MFNLLEKLFGDAAEVGASTEDLHRAALALLFEVARADGDVDTNERRRLLAALAGRWRIHTNDLERLLDDIQRETDAATDLFQYTYLLRDNWGPEKRARLIADMWDVALADGRVDPNEEQIIRRVSELLYVSHGDFIRGKLDATEKAGLQGA